MNPHYGFVAKRAAHRCEYCRAPEVLSNFPFEVEHIVPGSRRGSDDESNQALACRSCNLRKSNHTTGHDDIGQVEVPLFNPRQDSWEEHFEVDRVNYSLEGRTPTGRATVARLEMNSPAQIGARKQW